jgi:hypothetical protein
MVISRLDVLLRSCTARHCDYGEYAVCFDKMPCPIKELPQAVVEKYCKLDANGGKFSASNSNAKAILDLLMNEDEAASDTSVIIKSYKLGNAMIHDTGADVYVIYPTWGPWVVICTRLSERQKTFVL